jgi:hypothetical protein
VLCAGDEIIEHVLGSRQAFASGLMDGVFTHAGVGVGVRETDSSWLRQEACHWLRWTTL